MQTAKQLSVTLVNKPGRLAAMLSALAKEKVSLRALTVMDSGDRGKVRFVPDDFEAAAKVLDKLNVRYDACDVLLVDGTNQAGAFRKICERLAAEHLNIDYAYCSFGAENGTKGGRLAVIKLNDLTKAQRVLSESSAASDRRKPGRRPVYIR
jgi:hypothetical protein